LGVFRAARSCGTETDLPQGWQVGWQATSAQPLPDGTSQPLLGGPSRPVIESQKTALAGQDPEDLSDLHHGVVVFGGGGLGAENMFQPDPVVFLGIERVFDPVPFPPAAEDQRGHAFGRKHGEIGDVGVEAGRLGGDLTQEHDVGLVHTEHNVFDPAKVLEPALAVGAYPLAKPVGTVKGKQVDGFLPRGGLATFPESQDVFPAKLLASGHDGLASVKGIADQADRQFGKLRFESLTEASEALEFTVLLFGLRVVQVHLFMHEGEEGARGSQHRDLQHVTVASVAGGGLAALREALAAFFFDAAIDHQHIPAIQEANAIEKPALQKLAKHQGGDLSHGLGVHPVGVVGGVIRTGHGGRSRKTMVLRGLTAQGAQVPGGLSGLSLLVEAVAGSGAGQEGSQDLPPEVGSAIEAHHLHPGVGQAVEPVIEVGESPSHHPHQGLGA
jgi:hypothetical protein